MPRAGLAPIAVFALVMFAPLADATSVSASLEVGLDTLWTGEPVRFGAAVGALEIGASASLEITWSGARGYLVSQTREHAGAPGAPAIFVGASTANDSLAFGAATLRDVRCEGECTILLVAAGSPRARVGLDGTPVSALGVASAPTLWGERQRARDAFHHAEPAGSLLVGDAHGIEGLRLAAATPVVEGDVLLLLRNVSALVVGAQGGASVLDTTTIHDEGPLPGATQRVTLRHAALNLLDAEIHTEGDVPLALVAPVIELAGVTSVVAAAAWGSLTFDGASQALEGESLRATGLLDVTARFARQREAGDIALPIPKPPLLLAATLTGDATSVIVGGAQAMPEGGGGVVTSVATGVGVVALITLLLQGWLFPLFTRLAPETVLHNPKRRMIHDHIAAQPGVSIAEIGRALGVPETVVRHHVRMLEQQSFVAVRGSGRSKGVFPIASAYDPRATPETRILLRDETRRRLSAALVASPPITQRELADISGISRRLASYHLAHLERDELVYTIGMAPRRYAAAPRLHALLAEEPAEQPTTQSQNWRVRA